MPPELVALALWMAGRVLLDAGPRAARSCCRRKGRPRTELWAARTDAPLDGERLTAQPAGAARDAAARGGAGSCRALRRLEARGLVAIGAARRGGGRR